MTSLPVSNPPVPFLGKIPGGLRCGSMIRVNGNMHPGGERFDVNLMCGPRIHPMDDIALHLSVRADETAIVRNHYVDGEWFNEERYGGFPLVPEIPFEIIILATNASYKIAINGSHFVDFVHRLPFTNVTFVHVVGDTSINYIRMEESAEYSTCQGYPAFGLY